MEITTAVLEVLTNKVMVEENANVRPPATLGVMLHALLKMGRYYSTTMCYYWDMSVK